MNKDKSPCLSKKCSFCCHPVKVHKDFPDDNIPKDKNGQTLWKERDEYLVPESEMEKTALKTFDCVLHDESTGLCKDYEHRPDICRKTSCIQDRDGDIYERHRQATEENFLSLKK